MAHEQAQDSLHVPRQSQGTCHILVNLGRIYVDVDELLVLGVLLEVACLAVTEAAADGNDQICCRNGMVGGLFPVHACKPKILGMSAWHCPQAHEGTHHRQVVFLHQGHGFFGRAGRNHPAPHNGQRALSVHDFLGGLGGADAEISIGLARLMALWLLGLIVHFRKEEVAGNIHQHRAGTSFLRQLESLPQGGDELLYILDLVIVLGDGHGDIQNICFLEGITAQKAGIHLPRDGHHGNGIHEGGSQPRHQIGGTGAGGGDAHPHLARSPGIAIGSMSRILLVGHQDFPDALFIIESVIEGQDHAPGIAEDHIHAILFEAGGHGLCTCHLHLLHTLCEISLVISSVFACLNPSFQRSGVRKPSSSTLSTAASMALAASS